MQGLVGVGERFQLVDESPAQARAQVLAQSEPGRRRDSGGEDCRTAFAGRIDRDEERLLGASLNASTSSAITSAGLALAAAASRWLRPLPGRAPEVDDRLLQPALRERADASSASAFAPAT
jgi:hypothetical protein